MNDLWQRVGELPAEKRELLERLLREQGLEMAPAADLPARDETPPRNPVEETLARLWSEALGSAPVGIRANFFELGGDSIHCIQIVARARAAGIRITSQQIFDHPTVERLAAVAEREDASGAAGGPAVGPVPLTPIQRWFFDLELPEPWHWNQAVLLEADPAVHPDALEAALGILLDHHDALRLRFHRTPAGWSAKNAAPGELWPLARYDLSGLPAGERAAALERQAARLQAGFDLARGPLVAAAWFHHGEGLPARLLLAAHHLVVDAVSFHVLLEDLERLLRQLAAGEAPSLPPRTTSFQEWARRLEQAAAEPLFEEELAWWREQAVEVPPLPHDGDGEGLEGDAREIRLGLGEEETRRLLEEAPAALRAAPHEVVLAAVAAALAGFGSHRRIAFDLEGHGREELLEGVDLSRTVGWLTSLFPLVLDLKRAATPAAVLAEVKERLRGVPHRGAGFGVLRHLGRAQVREELRRLPAPEVMVNYLGRLDPPAPAGRPLLAAADPFAGVGPLFGPRGRRPHELQIFGGVVAGRLTLRLLYSPAVHRPETAARLARDIEARMADILALCRSGSAAALAPSDFPEAGLAAEELLRLPLSPAEIEDVYALSPTQEGMLFHVLADRDPGLYREQGTVLLRGGVDESAFRRAWERVVERHGALRTSFAWEGLRHPVQVIHRRVELPFTAVDWRGLSEEEVEIRFAALVAEDRESAPPLTRAPLLRVVLAHVRRAGGEEGGRLLVGLHHLIHDAWSLAVLLDEALAFYAEERSGIRASLPPAPSYRDYAAWLRRRDGAASEPFWRRELAGFAAPTPLPGGGQGAGERGYGRSERHLPVEESAALARFCRGGITLSTLIHAAWALMLSREAATEDVLFGTVVAGRPAELPEMERAVGLFIETLPLCLAVPRGQGAGAWLCDLQGRLLAVASHAATPLPRLLALAGVPPGGRLFESLVVMQNAFVAPAGRGAAGIAIEELDAHGHPDAPLMLRATPGERLRLELLFDGGRLSARTAGRLLDAVARLLPALARAAGDAPEPPLSTLLAALDEEDERARAEAERAWRQAGRARFGDKARAVTPISPSKEDR